MSSPTPHRRSPGGDDRRRQRHGCWLLVGLVCTVGCQSTREGTFYSYRELPPHLVASRRENAQTIDLSRLASKVVNSEKIDVGDVLEVTIASGLNDLDSITMPVRVNEAGEANLPIIGTVPVQGLEPVAAEAAITAACIDRQLYRSPQITVTMKQQRMNRITVTGAVKLPGVYEVPRNSSDLLAALVAAGGLSQDAGTTVEIRNPEFVAEPRGRDAPPIASMPVEGDAPVGVSFSKPAASGTPAKLVSQRLDLVEVSKKGVVDYTISDGGIVHVEKRDPEPVHVIGLVHKPNRYEFPIGEDLRVLDAIALAGGTSSPVASRVYVIRKEPNSDKTAIVDLNIRSAKRNEAANVRLSPGDIVSVEQTPATVLLEAVRFVSFGVGGTVPLR